MLKHHYTKWAIIEGLYKGRDVDIKRKDKKSPYFIIGHLFRNICKIPTQNNTMTASQHRKNSFVNN